MAKSKVYFTKDISPNGLIKVFEALKRDLKGNVAVKSSTGEPGGHNFLNPKLIEPLVSRLNGTIVECCTAYVGLVGLVLQAVVVPFIIILLNTALNKEKKNKDE